MLPVVADEGLIRAFKFYHAGVIQQGMSHRLKLYRLVESFDQHQRSQAYNLGCQLAHRGSDTVITVSGVTVSGIASSGAVIPGRTALSRGISGQHYKVWVEIRSSVGTGSLLSQADFDQVDQVSDRQVLLGQLVVCS